MLTTGKVYKVWLEIEEYDIEDGSGETITPLDISCTATFATCDEAVALAERMNDAFSDAPGQVDHE